MRFLPLLPIAALVLLAGCDESAPERAPGKNGAVTIDVPRGPGVVAGVTPMAERVAVLGLLNKRNGIVRDLRMRPGQAVRVRDAIVRLRACEASAPWENERLTGAFVQLDVEQRDGSWRRVFSGWLYKESPSLNVVEHAVYDVWPKSCEMRWPEGAAASASASASSNRSSAPKSGGTAVASRPSSPTPAAETPPSEPVAPTPEPLVIEPSAADNNPT